MADARLASHFFGNLRNDIRAEFNFHAPASFGKRPQPCEYAVVRLSADGANGIASLQGTGHGLHITYPTGHVLKI
jgi:hypothetical protein